MSKTVKEILMNELMLVRSSNHTKGIRSISIHNGKITEARLYNGKVFKNPEFNAQAWNQGRLESEVASNDEEIS